MSYKLLFGGKTLNVSLNIYYNPHVQAEDDNPPYGREIQVGDKVKWETLDSTNSFNSFNFTLNNYNITIPDDGYTYFLTAELDHSKASSNASESYMFAFKEGNQVLGFQGYRFGPQNRLLGQYSSDDPLDLVSDDGARVILQGPKTINLVITALHLEDGVAPLVVGIPSGTTASTYVSRARMLVWRL